MSSRAIWLLALLLISAMVINWYEDTSEQARQVPEVMENVPDLYMVNAHLNQYDRTGRLHHQIEASKFTHYSVTDITQLDNPRVVLYGDGHAPWLIESRSGQILPGDPEADDVVELWDDVRVHQQKPDGRFLNISTDRMAIVPATATASTDELVTVESPYGRIVAAGMRLHLDPLQLTFFSAGQQRVQTTIER